MNACLYASDLNDAEWALLAPLVPRSHPAGRRQTYPLRRIVDAIFYLLRTGAQWRLLPHEYPPRGAVFYHYAQWREDGTWEHVTQVLRESYRRTIGRNPQPTAAIIDSQSVKTTEMGGPRGYDGGKKINGRKRHLLVDTQGTLLKNKVHPADIHDRAGAELLLKGLQHLFPAIGLIWADTASWAEGLAPEGTGLALIHPAALVDRWRLDTGRRGAADAPERLSGARTQMGGRANDRLAQHQSAARQGL
jgi:putative transposase